MAAAVIKAHMIPPRTPLPPMATVADLAALLGIHRKTAERRIRAGDFKGAVKFGRQWYLPRRAIEALAEGQTP